MLDMAATFRRKQTPLREPEPEPARVTCVPEVRVNGHRLRILGRLQFAVQSATNKEDWYCVDLEPEGKLIPGCDCIGYRVHGHCWHLAHVVEFLDEHPEVDLRRSGSE